MVGISKHLRFIPQRWRRNTVSTAKTPGSAKQKESIAQYLPSHIIQRIAHFVAIADTSYTAEGRGYYQMSQASRALVGVSRSWRVAVIALFYRHFVLDINCLAMWISPSRRMVHRDCEDISESVKHLAKSVYITAPFDGIFNGRVVQVLDSNSYREAVFPEVSVLRLNFYSGSTVPLQESADYDLCISEFCAYIQRMFPRATEYRFQISSFTDTDDSQMVGRLLSEMIGTSQCQVAEYVHMSSGVQLSGLLDVRGLTHLSIKDQASTEDCIELMRRNASSLVSVDLGIVDPVEFAPQLVTQDKGTNVVYPRLKSLTIHVSFVPKDLSASFPALQDLNCTTGSLRIANVLPQDKAPKN